MKTATTTMHDYLSALPADRLEAITAVRYLVNRKLPPGYRETVTSDTIVWIVPLEACPDTQNGQPLTYAALANEKNYMALYLASVYSDPRAEAALRDAFAKAGRKLDMGRSCIRFRKLADLHLPAIGRAVAACSMEEFVRRAQAVRAGKPAGPAHATPPGAKAKTPRAKGRAAAR